MKPETQRIKIAEACHNLFRVMKYSQDLCWIPPGGTCEQDVDPLNDLNAMHEAITTRLQGYEDHFFHELSNVVNGEAEPHWSDDRHYIVNATAAQRAEAFLRTLGLWEEE